MEEQLELWYLDKYAKKKRQSAYRANQHQAAEEPLLPMAAPLGDTGSPDSLGRGKPPRGAKRPRKVRPTLKPTKGK